ncbi:hypothetical protein V3527_18020, partial [Acinetobacter variabilis]
MKAHLQVIFTLDPDQRLTSPARDEVSRLAMPRRLNLVNLLRSISMARKQCQVCSQPATVRVEANLNGRHSTMLLCDDHYRQLV